MSADPGSVEEKIALVGANGMLARMVRERAPQNCSLHLFDLPGFNMTDRAQVVEVLSALSPDVIINCAAFTNVDGAETAQELSLEVNGTAVGYLAEVARTIDATLIHISTDYIFDGQNTTPYVENDTPNPQSIYGHTKLAGEQAIMQSGLEKFFIIRTSWLYGPAGNNFVETILRLAAERQELRIVADQVGSPTFTGDLANAIFNLLDAAPSPQPPAPSPQPSAPSPQPPAPSPYGLYHFSNEGQCSWYEFANEIVSVAKLSGMPLQVKEIKPIKTAAYPLPATRPAYSIFDKSKYKQATAKDIPQWQESLKDYLTTRRSS